MKIKDIERRIADIVAINPRPEQPRALVAMGHELIARDVDAATKCFDKALAIDPRHIPAWVGRAEALSIGGRKGQAVGCLERALDVEPKNADLNDRKKKLLAELAVASSRNRRYDPEPTSSNPVVPAPSSSSRAVAPISEPQPAPISEPKLAPRLEPKPAPISEPKPSPKSEPQPAVPELELDRQPKSERKPPESRPPPASEPEPELEPEPEPEAHVDPDFEEAALLFGAGKHIEALRKVEPLTKKPDANAEVWMLRGAICESLDQKDPAIASYERATKVDPKSVPAWLALAWARVGAKRLERGLDAADQALRLAPFDGKVQKLRGMILLALGQGTVAVTAFEKATQHAPDDAEAWLELGRALQAVKRPDAARDVLKRALSIAETMRPSLVPAVNELLGKVK